ncbi:MAG: 4Fe-4S dicluster domain-containing protein [Bacillota bacterium]|nr:4Fe-4S dicluster domain-containing protein [Bacillota bacterium]
MKRIKVIKENCYDCRICELVCSQTHTGVYRPMMSRIKAPSSIPGSDKPVVCRQCKKPKCVEACPTGALTKGEEWILFDESLCDSCGLCVEACPFDAIWLVEEKLLKCDLCDGNPQCVAVCPGKALVYEDY